MEIHGPTGFAPANAAEAGACAMDVLGQRNAFEHDQATTGSSASAAAGEGKRKITDKQWQADPIVYH